MGEVVDLPVVTRLDLDPSRVLAKAAEAGLTEVVVIGMTDDDFYVASSKSDGGDCLWLLRRAEHKLMQIADDLEDGEVS